jgi:hypothetical protein
MNLLEFKGWPEDTRPPLIYVKNKKETVWNAIPIGLLAILVSIY